MTQQRASATSTERSSSHLQLHSSTQLVIFLAALFGILLYAQFLLNPANRGDLLPYLLVVVAETFLMLQAMITLWTIVSGGYNPRDREYHRNQVKLLGGSYDDESMADLHVPQGYALPEDTTTQLYLKGHTIAVDVFVTVYGEPLEAIRRTASAARGMAGRHQTYILDDGGSDDVKKLAHELQVNYIRRSGSEGAKAGNVNHALSQTSGDFFVIFDADFAPKPQFLYETLPFFADRTLAFVQTPQVYGNLENAIARGAGFMQQVFYQLIQPGKNRFNAAFCVGTNVVFRRSAIDNIGGMYQQSKSEDIWTSLLLHERGYRSVYIPDALAIGDTPDSIKAYSKQQLRWATGGMEILFWHNPLFSKRLSFSQRLQYVSTAAFYLQGVAAAMLLTLPMLQIFFGLTPINLSIGFAAWAFYYLAFYGLQMTLAAYSTGGFQLETILLAMASFPIYVKAIINGLLGRDKAWQATGATKIDSPYNYIIPQLLIFLFLLFTEGVGIIKALDTNSLTLTLFWNSLNAFVFGGFLYLASKERWRLSHAPAEPKRSQAKRPRYKRKVYVAK